MNYLIRCASWSALALQCSESFLKNLITLREKERRKMSKNEEDTEENFERSNKEELCMLTLVFPDMVGPTNIRPCLTTVVSYN